MQRGISSQAYGLFCGCFPEAYVSEREFRERLGFDRNTVLARFQGETLAGFSIVLEHAVLLLCVAPEWRGKGIGSGLLSESERVIREAGCDRIVLGAGPVYLFQGVPSGGEEPAFFVHRGYQASWKSVDLAVPLKDWRNPRPPCPEGVTFGRLENGEQAELLAAVGRVKPEWRRFYQQDEEILVARKDGEILGFCLLGDTGAPFAAHAGTLGCVGVVPEARKQGIGLALAAAAIEERKSRGYENCYVGYTYLEDWYGKLGCRPVMRFWMGEKRIAPGGEAAGQRG